MPEGEIEVAVEDGPPKDAEEKGTRRSKRDRKRRNHDFDPFPEKKVCFAKQFSYVVELSTNSYLSIPF